MIVTAVTAGMRALEKGTLISSIDVKQRAGRTTAASTMIPYRRSF